MGWGGIINFTHVVPSSNFALSQSSLFCWVPTAMFLTCYYLKKKTSHKVRTLLNFNHLNLLLFLFVFLLLLKASLPSFTNFYQQCYLSCTLCAVFDDHLNFICGCVFCWAAEWSCGQTADDSRKGTGTGGEGVQVCVWRLWPPLHHASSPEGNLNTE